MLSETFASGLIFSNGSGKWNTSITFVIEKEFVGRIFVQGDGNRILFHKNWRECNGGKTQGKKDWITSGPS